MHRCLLIVLFLATVFGSAAAAQDIVSPSEFLGFPLGADRQVADYRQITAYFQQLASASPRVDLEDLGETTLGNRMFMAVISSPENLKNKARYRQIARQLADPRGRSGEEVARLAAEGKVIVLVTCNIHSTEVGASQMAMEWAHQLATTQDPARLRWLDDVILLLVPSLNPDGQIMTVEWYRKYAGTPFEGGRMPWLYHHYVGHDNNRDWYMLTQKETRAMSRAVYQQWFPQVWLDEHQMGSTGPRIFVPPYAEPVDPDIHPLVWRGVNLIGTSMAWRLEEAGKSGVIYGYSYDAYWPGGTKNTAWFKNIQGLLTEVASARFVSPIQILPSELSGGRKGLIEYGPQTNFPNPWPGGWWRLRDIIDYELIVSDALLETCSQYRQEFLRAAARMAQDAVAGGHPEQYWRIPSEQRDPVTAARLAHLLREHGVEVLVNQGGDFLVPTAQPYRKFVDEMLGTQRFNEVKAVAGEDVIAPYDVAAWSLPLMMDVRAEKVALPSAERASLRPATDNDWPQGGIEGSGEIYAASPASNALTRLVNAALREKLAVSVARQGFVAHGQDHPAGTVLFAPSPRLEGLAKEHRVRLRGIARPEVPTSSLRPVRVALFKPWLASMDEGWTRFVLEQHGFDLKNISNADVKAGKLNERFDVIVLPDVDKETILEGKPGGPGDREDRYFAPMPPEYDGGIGKEGVNHLKAFVENGGTVVALASSSELVTSEFNVPVRNVLARTPRREFSSPGSLLRVLVDPEHPVTYGMGPSVAAFVSDAIAYQTSLPGAEVERAVLAWYPEAAEDILLSGWIRGAEKLEKRAAAVALEKGRGRLVLLGFRVQHRAQTEGTFKLLFNALRWAGMGREPQAVSGNTAAP